MLSGITPQEIPQHYANYIIHYISHHALREVMTRSGRGVKCHKTLLMIRFFPPMFTGKRFKHIHIFLFKTPASELQLARSLAHLAQCKHVEIKRVKLIKHAREECWRVPLPENRLALFLKRSEIRTHNFKSPHKIKTIKPHLCRHYARSKPLIREVVSCCWRVCSSRHYSCLRLINHSTPQHSTTQHTPAAQRLILTHL